MHGPLIFFVDMHQNNKHTSESEGQNKGSQGPKHSLAEKDLHFPEVSKFLFENTS